MKAILCTVCAGSQRRAGLTWLKSYYLEGLHVSQLQGHSHAPRGNFGEVEPAVAYNGVSAGRFIASPDDCHALLLREQTLIVIRGQMFAQEKLQFTVTSLCTRIRHGLRYKTDAGLRATHARRAYAHCTD